MWVSMAPKGRPLCRRSAFISSSFLSGSESSRSTFISATAPHARHTRVAAVSSNTSVPVHLHTPHARAEKEVNALLLLLVLAEEEDEVVVDEAEGAMEDEAAA